ncbi:GD17070 [Drosophila simulans]|uniref:GD17070 n=1 Tax=Drosophila simulans TaxID=7240 RepID=B4R3N1_DROSI|nr:GD17070 [Drosophila simulans]
MTMKSMKYSDCDTIMDGYNPVPPPLPRRVPPVRNIYAEPFAHEPNHSSRLHSSAQSSPIQTQETGTQLQ